MRQTSRTLVLDKKGVDSISDEFQAIMKEYGVQRTNIVKARLAMESVLLDIADHFDNKKEITVIMGSRFGSRFFTVRYDGSPYNPMEDTASDGWTGQLLSSVAIVPAWSHKNGYNEIYVRVPRNAKKSEMVMLSSVAAGVLLGVIQNYLPADISSFFTEFICAPISKVFMNMLTTFAGLVVFMSLLSGIIGIGNLSDFSKVGKYMVRRFLVADYIACGITILALIPFHRFTFGVSAGSSQWKAILDMLLNIIPSDPISPFVDGNILQLVFMAVIIGITMLILSREISVMQSFLNQANQVVIHVVEMVCRLLPLYIFASLAALIGKNGIGILKSVWKPFLFCIVMMHFMLFAKVIITAIKLKARPSILIRKILPTYLIGLTTASSMAAFGASMDINERKLGIPAELNRMGLPIGSVLNTYTGCIGFIAVIFYLAELHGISVSISWFISIFIGVTIITCAMPPVPGGILIGIGIILEEYGLPATDLALAGTIIMFCDFFMTAVRVGVLHLELALQADHWGKLDKEKLRSAVNK